MDRKDKGLGTHNLWRYVAFLALIWTAAIAASETWNIFQMDKEILEIARTSAIVSFEKDLLYRQWVARQGGVYVPVSEKTPPNPYLKVPRRDLTADGLALTLVNPAYMTRQVNEMAAGSNLYQAHLTSLRPIRPQNAPDPWEREALEGFERGILERSSVETLSGREYFRFMRPFFVESACLKCHAAQGYKEGDIRGGISVSILMAPLRTIGRTRLIELSLAHGLLWVMGLAGIAAGERHLRQQMVKRERVEKELLSLSMTDPLTGLHNRRGFLTLAEQQLHLAERTKRRMQLFFADLDGLKRINDTYGHEEGDRAIAEAAAALRETFRSSDIIARIGGDEFAILAIDTEGPLPEFLLERLQRRLDRPDQGESRKYALSFSVGCADYDPERPLSLNELMARADRLMYAQKEAKSKSV